MKTEQVGQYMGEKVTFLGPLGATFSHEAYDALAEIYGAPAAQTAFAGIPGGNCMPAQNNGDILEMVIGHGGYGAIAMETFAEGRVAEPLESFIGLLDYYPSTDDCPIRVVGALNMRIYFCLLARKGRRIDDIKNIIAHPKAIGACMGRIESRGIATVNAPSNGEAARCVAEDEEYCDYAALGPRSAAKKYGLEILHDGFQIGPAATTFFLVTPRGHKILVGKNNRALIVFKTPHRPAAFARAILPFGERELNLIQIHSVHVWNNTYNFAIEIEVRDHQLETFEEAMKEFRRQIHDHLLFGPFQVVVNDEIPLPLCPQ